MTVIHTGQESFKVNSILSGQNNAFFESIQQNSFHIFIKNWLNGKQTWEISTSGSTGKPKKILLQRKLMEYSIQQTTQALQLHTARKYLVAMNTAYVGGMMMVARALENQADIILRRPSSRVLKNLEPVPDFAAFVPLQIYSFLKDREQKAVLDRINKVIIGGGTLNSSVEKSLQTLKATFWQTYGMTETYSHVALRQLNQAGKQEYLTAVGDAVFSTDPDGRLIIKGTITGQKPLLTTDVVQLQNEKEFKWLGRYDNVINSGGVKLHPAVLEEKIRQAAGNLLRENAFFVTGLPDRRLGQKCVLFIEGQTDTAALLHVLKKDLPNFEVPGEIITVAQFAYTPTGKINRNETITANYG